MKVSVIIPCYNVEKYIEGCIHSVYQQAYENLEVICVNDGSKDQTVSKIEALQQTFAGSLKLINQENAGASAARNNGLEEATGDYFQFLDADDLLKPEKIKMQMALAVSNDYPDLIIGSYTKKSEAGEVIFEKLYTAADWKARWEMLMTTNLGITSANLFKADFFKGGGRWNTNLGSSQEYDLMFRILQKSDQVVFDPTPNTIIIQRDGGSISQTNLSQNWRRYVQLRVDIIDFLKEQRGPAELNAGYQILFGAIRMLYPFNSSEAIRIFKEKMPKDFSPEVTPVTSGGYCKMYHLLGFQNTERLRGLMKKVRS